MKRSMTFLALVTRIHFRLGGGNPHGHAAEWASQLGHGSWTSRMDLSRLQFALRYHGLVKNSKAWRGNRSYRISAGLALPLARTIHADPVERDRPPGRVSRRRGGRGAGIRRGGGMG